MRWALAIVLLVPLAGADHLDDGSYRCDGGWCSDGEDHILHCTAGGCTGDVRGFPTIRDPTFGDGSWLSDDDWILGISFGGESKAYPIRIISGQQGWEMVLDDVGNLPVTVTYCPLCGSSVAYSRILDGRVLTLLNSGAIWKQDLVMYDKQTESQWSQIEGVALDGPMHGRHLDVVPQSFMTWGDWHRANPNGQAMERPRDPEGRLLCVCGPVDFTIGQLMTGVVLDQAYAFAHSDVHRDGVAVIDAADGGLVAAWAGDAVQIYAGRGLAFTLEGGELVASNGQRYDAATGQGDDDSLERLPTRTTFLSRWSTFYPDSIYYETPVATPVGEDAPWPWMAAPFGLLLARRFKR